MPVPGDGGTGILISLFLLLFSFLQISFQHQNILMAVPGHVFDYTADEQESFSEFGVIKAAVNDFLNFMDFV